jgi:hypothetical protein
MTSSFAIVLVFSGSIERELAKVNTAELGQPATIAAMEEAFGRIGFRRRHSGTRRTARAGKSILPIVVMDCGHDARASPRK